ncbi:Ubiquinone biosynthesis O-methyltransferase, partial [Exaiptasia diaphana]
VTTTAQESATQEQKTEHRPQYDAHGDSMLDSRGPLAEQLCRQALATTEPFRSLPPEEMAVLDVGCGYGHTAIELARTCRKVVGIEPSLPLAEFGARLAADSGMDHVEIQHRSVEELEEEEAFDLVILDNVLEHLPNADDSLERISRSLRPGGLIYIVVPNKLWPIEHHYFLPFLGYLPLPLANAYLRLSGRGEDYEDASYAPTLWGLRKMFKRRPELDMHLVPPADISLTMAGGPWHYRLGVALLERLPVFWWIAKCFLVVAVKKPAS